MILIICGAGASYDSVDYRRPQAFDRAMLPTRPPLANELFLPDNRIVAEGFRTYPHFYGILPPLRNISKDSTVEDELAKFQGEAAQDPIRKQQLAGVVFYLRHLIHRFEEEWRDVHHGATNYVAMIDQLRRSHGKEPVCIVTFNYDCMIEDALQHVGLTFDSIEDYTKDADFKLFKLHGSVDWVNEVRAPLNQVNAGRNEREFIDELIRSAETIETSSDFRLSRTWPVGKIGTVPVWPAIAIPIRSKMVFTCPQDHLKCLEALLPKTTRILIIGWRGMETHFVSLLAKAVNNRQIGILAINGNSDEGSAVIGNLAKAGIPPGAAIPYESGFTDAIIRRQVEHFCK
jgi:hypothetical protein